MQRRYICPSALVLLLLASLPSGFRADAQSAFTVQVGSSTSSQVSLVAPADTWRYHKGTNAPTPGWQTNADASLDSTWGTGQGGFGYATDNAAEVALVQTPLPDMQNSYSTVYIRRSFEITNTVDPKQILQLGMDWDDGFVAWLDGVELSPRSNAPGAAGIEPPFTATATTSRESSRGNNLPQPAMKFSLGPVGDRLDPGTHTLAILGLNQATNSSDFVLLSELSLAEGTQPGVINGTLLSIVQSNSVAVSGTNRIAGSSRVLVEGVDAAFDSTTGKWSRTVPLSPGFNRLHIRALNAAGAQLFATNADIVSELSSVGIGGTLTGSNSLNSSMGIFHVTNSINVAPGGTLSIGPGCVFLFAPGAGLYFTNASLVATGTEDSPVIFAPADGASVWGGLTGVGPGTHLLVQHAELPAGRLELFDGSEGTFEDCYFHDYTVSIPAIIHTLGQPRYCSLTLRRCHVNRYHEILCQLSINRFEDCLMEYQAEGGDGIDFDGAQPGSFIRRCTVRHGKFTNVDAIDIGEYAGGEPSRGVLIESSLFYDFVDKGVSMGVQVDVCVTNCLLHHLDSGVSVKDLSRAGIYNCTIVSNNFGFHCYNKVNPSAPSGGGFITNSFNNILWGNAQIIALLNGSTMTASYSDFQGANVPGPGNLSLDPLWTAPAGSDFTLAPASPLLNAGRNGAAMGATFPLGAVMAPSHPTLNSVEKIGDSVVLRFWADSEKSYSLVASDNFSSGWTKVTDIYPQPIPRKVVLTNSISGSARFYRLTTPRLP